MGEADLGYSKKLTDNALATHGLSLVCEVPWNWDGPLEGSLNWGLGDTPLHSCISLSEYNLSLLLGSACDLERFPGRDTVWTFNTWKVGEGIRVEHCCAHYTMWGWRQLTWLTKWPRTREVLNREMTRYVAELVRGIKKSKMRCWKAFEKIQVLFLVNTEIKTNLLIT